MVAEHEVLHLLPHASYFLADALIEMGRTADALDFITLSGIDPERGNRSDSLLLHTRARARRAAGDRAAAVADLESCREIQTRLGLDNPNVLAWRSALALALSRDQSDRARELISAELARAHEVGQARAVGIALRVAGLVAERDRAVELLRESVTWLESCPSVLELARSEVELGAVLRRMNHPVDAREPLRRGMELAARGGAEVLVDQARAEMLAAGGRP
jgi:hypothetical protein